MKKVKFGTIEEIQSKGFLKKIQVTKKGTDNDIGYDFIVSKI